jgi:uncharacterized protein (DUF885 family)
MTARMRRSQTVLGRAALAIGLAALVSAGVAHADAGSDLTKLLRDYGDAEQKLRPRASAERGDSRYLDGYDESATATYLAARRRINEDMRARLARIDAAALKAQDGLTFEIFRWDLDDEARELNPAIAENYRLLAINQFNGTQVTFRARCAGVGIIRSTAHRIMIPASSACWASRIGWMKPSVRCAKG